MIGGDGFVVDGNVFAAAMTHSCLCRRHWTVIGASQRLRQERGNFAGEIEKTDTHYCRERKRENGSKSRRRKRKELNLEGERERELF